MSKEDLHLMSKEELHIMIHDDYQRMIVEVQIMLDNAKDQQKSKVIEKEGISKGEQLR
jgi:hypothetical protein